jgi:hypothetical protein
LAEIDEDRQTNLNLLRRAVIYYHRELSRIFERLQTKTEKLYSGQESDEFFLKLKKSLQNIETSGPRGGASCRLPRVRRAGYAASALVKDHPPQYAMRPTTGSYSHYRPRRLRVITSRKF